MPTVPEPELSCGQSSRVQLCSGHCSPSPPCVRGQSLPDYPALQEGRADGRVRHRHHPLHRRPLQTPCLQPCPRHRPRTDGPRHLTSLRCRGGILPTARRERSRWPVSNQQQVTFTDKSVSTKRGQKHPEALRLESEPAAFSYFIGSCVSQNAPDRSDRFRCARPNAGQPLCSPGTRLAWNGTSVARTAPSV